MLLFSFCQCPITITRSKIEHYKYQQVQRILCKIFQNTNRYSLINMGAGGALKSFCYIFILVLVYSVLLSPMLEAESRPFRGSRLRCDAVEEINGRLFSLKMRKMSGPSPGIGHKYENFKTLGGLKNSGPSPGDGHHKTITGNKQ